MKRGKQLSVSEWLEVFKHYKEYLSGNITRKEFCNIYSKIRNSENYFISKKLLNIYLKNIDIII
ncbi:transposase domain protein [Mycoplasma mycoides subsp. mycoides]|uniref:Transposase domain protein n=1 Tax=Mycoplasma mycoides subsp. mycoides TaxID=2103 RepID=A0AAE2EIR1_MYCMY|nr:hypothetical protein MSCT144_05050 [Mycoplasma mycoides subsp. mycoides]KJQ46541.1 transposase domain protein [Mycoplasma mycoides subsp. mycoides]KJQ47111.1 transposase domain protein [Mycoplasma mycoides subsp. mycoides]BCU83812.1 hypothetical protein mmcaprivi_01910 [Mycoplasma mycoides]